MSYTERRYHLHASLGFRLSKAARVNDHGLEAELAPLGLTRAKWHVLLAIVEENISHPSDIAEFTGMHRTAVSRTLTQLEAQALVVRKEGDNDKRTTLVAVTSAGANAVDASLPRTRENALRFANALTEEELEVFLHLLERLAAQHVTQ